MSCARRTQRPLRPSAFLNSGAPGYLEENELDITSPPKKGNLSVKFINDYSCFGWCRMKSRSLRNLFLNFPFFVLSCLKNQRVDYLHLILSREAVLFENYLEADKPWKVERLHYRISCSLLSSGTMLGSKSCPDFFVHLNQGPDRYCNIYDPYTHPTWSMWYSYIPFL